ncbi:unnamed protein product [Polarella glacialis]|uniref:Ubiquitin-like protease family profile domain-containing protein n=1 Tax=Polarella glacialis TaxID=89957 RepID=A0A813EB18_POLGL|nr:unnamed protein product [Polarella glacialis]
MMERRAPLRLATPQSPLRQGRSQCEQTERTASRERRTGDGLSGERERGLASPSRGELTIERKRSLLAPPRLRSPSCGTQSTASTSPGSLMSSLRSSPCSSATPSPLPSPIAFRAPGATASFRGGNRASLLTVPTVPAARPHSHIRSAEVLQRSLEIPLASAQGGAQSQPSPLPSLLERRSGPELPQTCGFRGSSGPVRALPLCASPAPAGASRTFTLGTAAPGAMRRSRACSQPPSAPVADEDEDDLMLQEAICLSLQEADLRRRALQDVEADRRDLQEALALSMECPGQERKSPTRTPTQSPRPRPPPPGLAETFAPAQWLSDASLAYGFARLASSGLTNLLGGVLQEEEEIDIELSCLPQSILLVDPATAFWVALQDDPDYLAEARSSLRLAERELVLCPINNSEERYKADSGSHWSLLVCWREGHGQGSIWRCSYYDSLARLAVDCGLEACMQKLQKAESVAERLLGEKHVPVASFGPCAQQLNFFDCGVYVLMFCRVIIGSVLNARHLAGASPSGRQLPLGPWLWEQSLMGVTPAQVKDYRLSFQRKLMAAERWIPGFLAEHHSCLALRPSYLYRAFSRIGS